MKTIEKALLAIAVLSFFVVSLSLLLVGSYERNSYLTTRLETLGAELSDLRGRFDELEVEHEDLMSSHSQLNERYNELSDSHAALELEHGNLERSHGQLQINYEQLKLDHESLLGEHESLRTDYNSLSADYEGLQSEYNSLNADHKDLQWKYNRLYTSHGDLMTSYEALKTAYEGLQTEYDELKAKKGLVLKSPTLEELKVFLREDRTDKHLYLDEETHEYLCIDFAIDLRRSAMKRGYNVSWVSVYYKAPDGESYAHALNAAYLADGALVFIEPQTDELYYDIRVGGQMYWYAGTIIKINFIW